MKHAIVAATILLSAALCVGCESTTRSSSRTTSTDLGYEEAPDAGRAYAGDADRGKLVFDTNCATCHGADGRAGGVGPSLIDENQRQDLQRTIVWIENPNPPMPALYPSPLSEHDVEDVAAFVQTIH